MSKESLNKLTDFLSIYEMNVESADIDEKYGILEKKFSLRASSDSAAGPGETVLQYEPHDNPYGDRANWAAATEEASKELLRFCSKNGRFMLREMPDLASGKSNFYLVAEQGDKTENVEVVVDGNILTPGENGLLDTVSAGVEITRNSRVIVRSDRVI